MPIERTEEEIQAILADYEAIGLPISRETIKLWDKNHEDMIAEQRLEKAALEAAGGYSTFDGPGEPQGGFGAYAHTDAEAHEAMRNKKEDSSDKKEEG